MKYILLCLLLLLQGETLAQSYSCISQEPKTYFTNSRGYLRGMRIDSVRSEGGNTVYYPFKTARIRAHAFGTYADTNGGSWLGSMLIESPDGFTHIPNNRGDTIFIKNSALLNDSWIMYQDNDPIYYLATVTAIDTLTIGNFVDSVKTIRLSAMEGGNVLNNDSLNGLELILSKQNGFVQAMDLFLFPYRDTVSHLYNKALDYYLYESMGLEFSFSGQRLIFRRADYKQPTGRRISNFEISDVIVSVNHNNPWEWDVYRCSRDTIVGKNVSGDTTWYDIHTSYFGMKKSSGGMGLEFYSGTWSGSSYATDMPVVDTQKMPEEWHNPRFYYFREGDSSFCHKSNVHSFGNNFLRSNGQLNSYEDSRNSEVYKEGLGMTWMNYSHFPTEASLSFRLSGARKNGLFCGSNGDELSIEEEKAALERAFKVYPNPANDKVNIITSLAQPFNASLINILGNEVGVSERSKNGQLALNVTHLSPGIYLVRIEVKGQSVFRKILVRHTY